MPKYKTIRQKLEAQRYTDLVDMPSNLIKRYPDGKLYIPSGADIESAICNIPEGELRSSTQMRDDLGRKSGGATTCALVFGILWRLVAEAAEEDRRENRGEPTPYWRVVRDDGCLNEKLPGGIEGHAAHLRAEGHLVEAMGRSNKLKVVLQ